MGAAEELLSVVDPSGALIGGVERSVVHREGLWHETFHCLIVRTSLPAHVVLQRRSSAARAFPGLLDLSATGHLQAGETPLEGVREIREELGIDVAPQDLVPLGRRLFSDDHGEGTNRELAHVYLLADDRALEEFPLDPREVGGLVEIATDDLLTVLGSPDAAVPCVSIGTSGQAAPSTCRQLDLVPPIDGYWTVLAVMATRFAHGESPIAI